MMLSKNRLRSVRTVTVSTISSLKDETIEGNNQNFQYSIGQVVTGIRTIHAKNMHDEQKSWGQNVLGKLSQNVCDPTVQWVGTSQ